MCLVDLVMCVCAYHKLKVFCRLRLEHHSKLELIRVGDWGRRIISLFRLAVRPKHQRRAAQYEQIVLTSKPKASFFISTVWCMRKRLMFLLMRSCQTVIHPTDAGRIKHHVKHDVHEILSLALLSLLSTHTQTLKGQLGVCPIYPMSARLLPLGSDVT